MDLRIENIYGFKEIPERYELDKIVRPDPFTVSMDLGTQQQLKLNLMVEKYDPLVIRIIGKLLRRINPT